MDPMIKEALRRERLLGFLVGIAVCVLIMNAERLFIMAGF